MPDEFERFVRALGRPYGGTFLLDRQEVKQTGRVRALSVESPFPFGAERTRDSK